MMKTIQPLWRKAVQSWPLTHKWGPRWGERSLVLTVLVAILLLVAVFSDWDREEQALYFAKVLEGDFAVTMIEAGDVEAISQIDINAPMMWGSKLQIIDLVEEGTTVKEGDFLVQFDVADLEAQLDLAKDNLETLKADLKKLDAQNSLAMSNQLDQKKLAQYSLEQAKLNMEMQQFESDVIKEESRIQLRQAELDLETAEKQIASRKIIQANERLKKITAIRQAEIKVQNIEERMTEMRLTAPRSGLVVYNDFRGERVKNGLEARAGQALMSIPSLDKMRVAFFVNEVDRFKISEGQTADVMLDAYPDLKLTGRVTHVASMAQNVRHDVELKGFAVEVVLNEHDPRLRPGMSARVSIKLQSLEDVQYIPLGALHEVAGESVVYKKGSSSPTVVEAGPRNDGFIVVKGLKTGQELVWNNGMRDARFWGQADEQARIEAIRNRLTQSFAVFEKRGILHDYLTTVPGADGSDAEKADEKPGIDISKLPPALRNRLKQDAQGESEAQVKVDEPGKIEKGTFRVSPEMMKRLKKEDKPSQPAKATSQGDE